MLWRESYVPTVRWEVPVPPYPAGLRVLLVGQTIAAYREMELWDRMLPPGTNWAFLDPTSAEDVLSPSRLARIVTIDPGWQQLFEGAGPERSLAVVLKEERAEMLHLGPPTEDSLEAMLRLIESFA